MKPNHPILGQVWPRRTLVRRWYLGTPLYAGTLHDSRARLGMGLFSRRSYKAGDLIFKIKGRIIHRRNSNLVEAIRYPNAVGLAVNKWIDPFTNSPLCSINHSCSANVGYLETGEVLALRSIRKGVEITLDYSISESDPFWEFAPQTSMGGCACGSPRCRGRILPILSIPHSVYRSYLSAIPIAFRMAYRRLRTGMRNRDRRIHF